MSPTCPSEPMRPPAVLCVDSAPPAGYEPCAPCSDLLTAAHGLLRAEAARIEHPCVLGAEVLVLPDGLALLLAFRAGVRQEGFGLVALARRIETLVEARLGQKVLSLPLFTVDSQPRTYWNGALFHPKQCADLVRPIGEATILWQHRYSSASAEHLAGRHGQ